MDKKFDDRFESIRQTCERSSGSQVNFSEESLKTIEKLTKEFSIYLSTEAISKVSQDGRKKVTGEDILHALSSLGYDDYHEALNIYLNKIRESKRHQS